MKLPPLQNRAAILLFFLFLWAALVAAHLFFYTVISRDKYIERGNAIALREGKIPARRGRLLDKEGMKIAWSIIYIDFYALNIQDDPLYRSELQENIQKYFPEFAFPDTGEEICIRQNLSPVEQLHLLPIVKRFPELSLKSRKERKYISKPIGDYLQKTGIEDCTMGKDGVFNVMADRKGNWIPGTWVEKITPLKGNDFKLELTLDQLIEETRHPSLKKEDSR